MQVGDRVRYTGNYALYNDPESIGQTGVVDKIDHDSVRVLWDHTGTTLGVYADNIELIETGIDTSKPLAVNASSPVTFITETSEGHLLVSIANAASAWTIFDKQGKFVRSENGGGSVLTLRNKPVVTTEYAAVSQRGEIKANYLNRELARDQNPDAAFIIRIHKEDGVVTNVDAVKR